MSSILDPKPSGSSGSSSTTFLPQSSGFEFLSMSATPAFTGADIGLTVGTSLYFPQLIRVDDKLPESLRPMVDGQRAKYVLTLSTDHDPTSNTGTGTGGVWVLWASSITGSWVQPVPGPVWKDATSGKQSETFQHVWDPIAQHFHVYYQQESPSGGRNQNTLLAITRDFVNYERVGICVMLPDVGWPGDGHTGYMAPVRRSDGSWFASHLAGGGDYGRYMNSYSADGFTWVGDPAQKHGEPSRVAGLDMRVFPTARIFRFNGELWAASSQNVTASGAVTGIPTAVAGPISSDMRRFTRPPEPVYRPRYAWEIGASTTSYFIDLDGTMWSVVTKDFNLGFCRANFKVEGVVA